MIKLYIILTYKNVLSKNIYMDKKKKKAIKITFD